MAAEATTARQDIDCLQEGGFAGSVRSDDEINAWRRLQVRALKNSEALYGQQVYSHIRRIRKPERAVTKRSARLSLKPHRHDNVYRTVGIQRFDQRATVSILESNLSAVAFHDIKYIQEISHVEADFK